MSYFLRIFCQSLQPVTAKQITDFILNGCYFEKIPRFELLPAETVTENSSWKSLTIYYQQGKRPIRIELNVNDILLQQEIQDTRETLELSEPSSKLQNLIQQLVASKQVIAIEVDDEGLSDCAWEMIDCLEAFLAKGWNGIIYAPEDGFYDENLQSIYKLLPSLSVAI
ncbi:MAG: hypothetical protein F6K47_16760 [Symploca sp. SIO2E6]|nr:hypothetical protein [Symploca sp. SIO2E6]